MNPLIRDDLFPTSFYLLPILFRHEVKGSFLLHKWVYWIMDLIYLYRQIFRPNKESHTLYLSLHSDRINS